MILLSANQIKKIYGEKVLFDDLSLTVDSTDKIGIIGINGTGKSTLLKILAGFETIEAGEIATSNELIIEYLPQNPFFEEESTVLEQIFKGNSPIMHLLRDYEKTIEHISRHPDQPQMQQRLIMLSEKMDAHKAWQVESEAKAVLNRLGISSFDQKIGKLSGGQRKKIALAGALIRPCNLLILDEPTNHLDNDTITYLEELLKQKKCAVVMVTHDRYFLDRVANKIMELDKGKLYKYEGNYGQFIELKAQREEQAERMREKAFASYKKELEWMRKGVEARRTKQKARQDRFYELEESLEGNNKQNLDMALGSSRLGKKIIMMEDITKSFNGKELIKDFTYTILKEDRIGIVGNNGLGKSTLLNLITRKFSWDKGIIEIGETVRIGYYTQENKEMDLSMRVIDYIKDKAEYVKLADGTAVSASKMLEKFLFSPAMQYTPISKLSGGERRRLYLLGVLMEDINVLLLDEPTNDLDIYTLQVLENFIDDFNGPVIAVSHDRYFLDRVADKIFAFEGDGKITNYPGNFSDYYQKRQQQAKFEETAVRKEKIDGTERKASKEEAPLKLKFTYKEKIEYEQIDERIEGIENCIKQIESEMIKYATDFSKLQQLTNEKEEQEAELEIQIKRWEYLSELAEKVKAQT